MRGGDELVGVRLDADGHPDLYALPLAEPLRDVRDPDDLLERVEHDPPDSGLDGALDLGDGLVVAVEGDAFGGHPGVERDGQLTTGADVEVEPLLLDPAHDGPRQERLSGVEDIGVPPEGVGPGAATGAEVALVEEVGGRPEFLGQPGHFDPADGDDAVVVAGDGAGPDLLVEDVEVGGRGCVVALGQDVGVTGTGGVCGSAHGVALLSQVSQRTSGALMPSRDRPPASTVPAASATASRERWAAEGFSSPMGSGGQASWKSKKACATSSSCRASRSGAR